MQKSRLKRKTEPRFFDAFRLFRNQRLLHSEICDIIYETSAKSKKIKGVLRLWKENSMFARNAAAKAM